MTPLIAPSSRLAEPLLLGLTVALLVFVIPSGTLRAQTAYQAYSEGVEAYNRGDLNVAKERLQRALAVDPNFRPASALLARATAAKKQPTGPGFNAKTLEHLIVPVEFSDTSLASALEYIRGRVAADTESKVLINFAMNLPPELAQKKITLKLQAVPVLEVLRYIGDLAGVKFEKQQYAIVVTPAGDRSPASPAPASAPNS